MQLLFFKQGLAGALLCGVFNKKMERFRFSAIISFNVAATGVAFFLIALWLRFVFGSLPKFADVVIFVLMNLIIAVSNAILSVNLSARFQKEIPNEMMGRVGAFTNAILTVCIPFGQVAAGLSLGSLPKDATYAAAGVLCLLLMVFNMVRSKKDSSSGTDSVPQPENVTESKDAPEPECTPEIPAASEPGRTD